LSYNARSGHGYGQQSRHSGAPHYGQRKAKQPTLKVPSNKTLNDSDQDRSENSIGINPRILVKIPATWTQPSLTGELPTMDVKKQAFQLAQVLTTRRTLELQLIEPNQNVLNFKVSKIEDFDSEIIEQQQDNTILPNQSYPSFEYVISLRSELAQFGYSLVRQE
jgi:hypothetical protein